MKRTLNIIGGGRVGKVLGRLFASAGAFTVQDVLNRSVESAQRAVEFVGEGRAVSDTSQLRPADVYLVAVPDDQIAACCARLGASIPLQRGAVVFHCSGARSSLDIVAALPPSVAAASVHPVRSFADPAFVAAHFDDTFCSIEGAEAALQVLEPALRAIGARVIRVDGQHKILYHAASVFASNYLVALFDIALRAYEAAGIPEDVAREMMAPLARESADNVFRLGAQRALTGPIARGDWDTVVRQQQAVDQWHGPYGEVYRALAEATRELAARSRDT